MAGFFEALLKFFGEFSWKRFFASMIVLALLFMAFSLYERYTSSFRLSRLQKEVELLAKIQELELKGTNGSQEFQRARTSILNQYLTTVERKPLSVDVVPATVRLSLDTFWKFLAGAALWMFIAAANLPKAIRNKKDRQAVAGLLLFALVTGLLGVWVKPLWWPWFHLAVFPLMVLFLVGLPSAMFVALRRRRHRKSVVPAVQAGATATG